MITKEIEAEKEVAVEVTTDERQLFFKQQPHRRIIIDSFFFVAYQNISKCYVIQFTAKNILIFAKKRQELLFTNAKRAEHSIKCLL